MIMKSDVSDLDETSYLCHDAVSVYKMSRAMIT